MKIVDYLIIGGSAAGTTAAGVIRSLKPDASITIVTDENHEQYSRVQLPHYIRHKVTREQLFLKKPDWYQEQRIELLKGNKQSFSTNKQSFSTNKQSFSTNRVKSLENREHKVSLENGGEIQYRKLLIAIGGSVVKLSIPGSDLDNILYMRTIEDADEIIKLASASKKGVIIGGGFIGLEFTSCFKRNGVSDVTVLVVEPYYWQEKLDEASSQVLTNTLEKNGVKVLTGEEVDHFEKGQTLTQGLTLKTKSGKTFEADVVGVGIGIRSDLSWLEGSGIKTNRAIVTNEFLETNLPDVYAAGDCAEFKDVIFDRQHIMGNWANATSQGSAVGKTMVHSASSGQAGQRTVFETASSYSINYFDGACSFIGVTDDKFADEVVSRGSVEAGKMVRIYIKTISGVMRIVGATVINNPAEVAPLTSAVKNKIDIFKYKIRLSDSNFDLKNLLES